jgi:hypothetical protein
MNMMDAATEAGVGPFTQTYAAPEAAAITPDYMTVTYGSDSGIYAVTSAFGKSLSLEWAYGQAVTGSIDLGGYAVVTDTLAALSEAAVADLTYANGCQASVYIDAWGGTMGSTAFTKCLSGNVTIDAQRQVLGYAGSCYPSGTYDPNGWNITGSLKLESDATSAAWVDALLSASQKKLLRIEFTNGGAGAAERTITIDLQVQITVADTMADDNGLQTFDLDFMSVQEDDNDYFEMVITNDVASIW